MSDAPAAPVLEHVLHLEIEVGTPVEVGRLRHGVRRMVPITGGTVEGPLFSGRVVPGGADIQLLRDEREAELEARYVLQTDGGDLVTVHNSALRVASPEDSDRLRRGLPVDPARVYFRGVLRFETPAVELARLHAHLYLGVGTRLPDRVLLDVFEVQ